MRKLLLLPCLIIAAALALAACGSSDESSKVEEAIETAATTTNPADCAKFETQQFMEQISKENGKAALKKCEEEAENKENAESVEVSDVEVEGTKATAEAALMGGGGLNGQTLEVALVKEGDQWKLDEAVKFTKFDSAKLVEAFEREIEKSGEANSKFASCFLEALKQADQAQVEKLFFDGSGAGFNEIAKSCS